MANKAVYDDRSRNTTRSSASNAPKTVCVDVGRVMDSCSDRDCIENVRVFFSACDQQRIDEATCVRSKGAKIVGTSVNMEELPFKEGCYSCKITFFAEVQVELNGQCDCGCDIVCGCAVFEKKVVLYGGEGNVEVFSGEMTTDGCDQCQMIGANTPRCVVQVAKPVVLDVSVMEACGCSCGCMPIPESIGSRFGGLVTNNGGDKVVIATVGVFSIVQLIRNAQLMVPVYDYCLPCKECSCDEETPCDLFKKIAFPIEEFFPPMGK